MKPIYKVPVIPNNLRHKETFIQIADALKYLNNVFDDVLERINNRISDKQKHVAILQGRIIKVHEKVQKITKTKKSTQVFSNSKYPMTKFNEMYKSVFGTIEGSTIDYNSIKTKMKLKEQLISEQSNNVLQFYHVKVKKDSGMKPSTMSGLGRFPPNAQLVNEILLFNTLKNPYKHYEMLDPLSSHTNENIKQSEESVVGPDAAPLSMTQRTGTMRESKENYFYSPDLGDVPTIDVPLDLPNLPGVADDLRYLMELGPGIAPSVTTTPIIPELPQITQTTQVVPQPISPDNSDSMMETTNMDVTPIDLPELPTPSESSSMISSTPLPTVEAEQSSNESKMEVTVTDRPISVPISQTDVSTDIRASLMEAIRQAGKKNRLHSVQSEEKPKSQAANIGNDLMADLHAKLAMRRKGISGIRAAEGGLEVSSAMNRVSAMIPPPVSSTNEPIESLATEDEENDWDE